LANYKTSQNTAVKPNITKEHEEDDDDDDDNDSKFTPTAE